MTDMTVSRTILAQLGGNRFIAMTGAKNLVGSDDALLFGLPSRPRVKINCIRITLLPCDTYRVEFMRLYNLNVTTLATYEDVYADNLRELFTRYTGLRVSL